MKHRITFQRKDYLEQTLTVPAGIRLSKAAEQAGYDLRTHCGGAGTCGKCQVIVNHQKILACQTIIESDLNVLIPETSLRTNEQNVVVQLESIDAQERGTLASWTTKSPLPIGERVRERGKTSKKIHFPHPSPLPKGEGATEPGSINPPLLRSHYGIAIDIGTTTLAAELHDFTGKLPVQTASRANPQRKFGDDVISRIQKVMENPAALTAMQQLIVDAINGMTAELAEKSGIVPQDIAVMVVAGNTVMQSLLFGIDPSPLGTSPFCAPVNEFPARRGSELGLTMSPEGTVEALPIFGGFVGGDIVAGVLTLPQLQSSAVPRFLLDIGTNGEIVLAHRGELFTAATAAGPAFEGAKIEHGTLAVPGAIDHVEAVSGKITVSTIGGKPAVGICGSGLIDAAAVLLEQGIILPGGRLASRESCFELVSKTESGNGESIVLTQRDIRELQLAAGAIRAGIVLLLRENGVLPEEIETFYVSGGFGQSIRLSSARRMGLLPAISSERFVFCGNTSLAGARAMLLNSDNAEVVRRIIGQSHHSELAALPQFQDIFAESIRFPTK